MRKFICIITAFATMICITATSKVKADAAIHLDFWNSYEKHCDVYYEYEGNGYLVEVFSEDCHTIWTNNTDLVAYWYTYSQLKEMTGKSSFAYIGSVSDIDIKSNLLNDITYFRRFAV